MPKEEHDICGGECNAQGTTGFWQFIKRCIEGKPRHTPESRLALKTTLESVKIKTMRLRDYESGYLEKEFGEGA